MNDQIKKWVSAVQELRSKRNAIDELLSDKARLEWYPELFDSIIDCMEDDREFETVEYFLNKKLKEINEEL